MIGEVNVVFQENKNNPTKILCTRFDESSHKESEVLCGILRELREEGCIKRVAV